MGWAWIALVWYLSLTARPPLPDMQIIYADKLGHLLAYGWLMGWFANLYHARHARVVFAVVFVLMGIVLEFLQGMGSARMFEYADMLANSLGVLLAYVLTLGSLRFVLFKLESVLIRVTRL